MPAVSASCVFWCRCSMRDVDDIETCILQVEQLFARRRSMLRRGQVDMALAELLAAGSLMLPFNPDDSFGRIRRDSSLQDSDRSLADSIDAMQPDALTEYVAHPTVDVRLSGQDSERGTFNQRHAVIYDQTTAQPHCPLNDLGLGPQASLALDDPGLMGALSLRKDSCLCAPCRVICLWHRPRE